MHRHLMDRRRRRDNLSFFFGEKHLAEKHQRHSRNTNQGSVLIKDDCWYWRRSVVNYWLNVYTHMILWWRVFWFDSFTPSNDGICPQWVFQIRCQISFEILCTEYSCAFWQQLWLITHFFFYIRLHLKNFPNSTEPHSVCHFLLFFFLPWHPPFCVSYNPFESIIRNSCVDTCPGRISGRVSGRTRRRKIKMVNVSFLCKEDARALAGGGYNTDRSSYHFFLGACFSFSGREWLSSPKHFQLDKKIRVKFPQAPVASSCAPTATPPTISTTSSTHSSPQQLANGSSGNNVAAVSQAALRQSSEPKDLKYRETNTTPTLGSVKKKVDTHGIVFLIFVVVLLIFWGICPARNSPAWNKSISAPDPCMFFSSFFCVFTHLFGRLRAVTVSLIIFFSSFFQDDNSSQGKKKGRSKEGNL